MKWFKHFFTPHEKNNHRAKLLHHSSLFLTTILFLFTSFFIHSFKISHPDVLGISYSITTQEVLDLTNKERTTRGLQPVSLNQKLSQAAAAKAKDMFEKNYWAHFAPDGTTPWYFIKNSGYTYLYAGENLAKGFTTSSEVVTAWMNSPSHRENMLSDKYKDIGFAISEGKLQGEDTVLVVEMFGTSEDAYQEAKTPPVEKQVLVANAPTGAPAPRGVVETQQKEPVAIPQPIAQQSQPKPLFDALSAPRSIGLIILFIFAAVLIIDLVVIERKKIARIVGHNLDHLFLIAAFIIFILIEIKGSIF